MLFEDTLGVFDYQQKCSLWKNPFSLYPPQNGEHTKSFVPDFLYVCRTP